MVCCASEMRMTVCKAVVWRAFMARSAHICKDSFSTLSEEQIAKQKLSLKKYNCCNLGSYRKLFLYKFGVKL